MLITRRDAVKGAVVSAAALAAPAYGALRSTTSGIPFGAAIHPDPMRDYADYRSAYARHCQVIVGEGGLKWPNIRPSRDVFDFTLGDQMLAFARSNGLEMRGHTLAWCDGMPDWTRAIGSATEAERELRQHIERVVGHYRGRIRSWDVVNEPVADSQLTGRDLRAGLWSRYLGEAYIATALRAAAAADPMAELVINEYGIENTSVASQRKRNAFRRLIRRLKDQDVPLHGIGVQAHLDATGTIDRDGLSRFAAEMKSLGLKILITELDVNDQSLPADIATRDEATAKTAHRFLTAVSAGARPSLVCTWGLSDRHMWTPDWRKRPDGLANRMLPLDDQYQPKPMMVAIERFCRGPA